MGDTGREDDTAQALPLPLDRHTAAGNGVWFFAEHKDRKLDDACFLVAGEGRNLADKLEQELSVVLIGEQIEELAQSFGSYGVDKALVTQDTHLRNFTGDAYADVFDQLVHSDTPSIVLFAATPIGNDLAPRVAARLEVGLASRYTEIEIDRQKEILVHRPIHGGKARETLKPLRRPLVATVDPQSLTRQQPKAMRDTKVVDARIRIDPKTSKTHVTDYLKADPCAVCVSEAEIVIGVGKGLQCLENLTALEELARVLGGSIGGSRRATDERWIADERRIGLTGKTIAPRIYLMCGISGAFHHTLSIKGSQLILSINTDRSAPINRMADLAVIGDMHEIVPELTKQLRDIIKPTG